MTPPRSLVADGRVRALGVGMAIAMGVGLVLLSRLSLSGEIQMDGGVGGALPLISMVIVAVGSAAAAAVGRSLRAGLQACAWATALGELLILLACLIEAPRWTQRGLGSLLYGDGVNLGPSLDGALWWTLAFIVLLALPLGVIGAALGSAPEHRRRARGHSNPVAAS
ncbi:MAG: hypothetical protein ACRDJO_13030 [Actinomycetota bacterium]